MTSRRIRDWLLVGAPIVALIAFTFIAALVYVANVSNAHDSAAARRETRLLTLALERQEKAIAATAGDYGEWDDAYDKLVRRLDPAWADANFYPLTFDHLAVYDETGKLVYERSSPQVLEQMGQRLRASEMLGARIGDLIKREDFAFDRGLGSVTSYELGADGQLLSVAAIVIHPANGPANAQRRLYLFAFDLIDAKRLSEFAAGADISAARFTSAAQYKVQAGYLALPVTNGLDQPIGNLVWAQAHPGAIVAREQAPWLACVFALLGLGAAFAIGAVSMAQLRAAEKARLSAEAANVAKSQFLANMSHELRTPLHAIMGFSEILMEDAEASGELGARRDLERVHAASQHLLSLVNDILDLSKVETGALEANVREFDLEAMLDTVTATAKPLFIPGDNEFTCVNVSGVTRVKMDQRFLRQILLNLLSNAAKFTHRGRVRLNVDLADDKLVFEIIDNGVGMTQSAIAKLFNPFAQADATIATKYGGTGLGLALSRNLARLMGGDISVISAPDEGSTFTLAFPLDAVCPEPEKTPVERPRAARAA